MVSNVIHIERERKEKSLRSLVEYYPYYVTWRMIVVFRSQKYSFSSHMRLYAWLLTASKLVNSYAKLQ